MAGVSLTILHLNEQRKYWLGIAFFCLSQFVDNNTVNSSKSQCWRNDWSFLDAATNAPSWTKPLLAKGMQDRISPGAIKTTKESGQETVSFSAVELDKSEIIKYFLTELELA